MGVVLFPGIISESLVLPILDEYPLKKKGKKVDQTLPQSLLSYLLAA